MSNANLPSSTHETTADVHDMDGTDTQDEYVGDDTVDDAAVLDDADNPVDDEDDLAIEDDDLDDADDDLEIEEDDDDLLNDDEV